MKIPVKVIVTSLYAYDYFNHSDSPRLGGAELQLFNLAVELAKDLGFDVGFVVGNFGGARFETVRGVKLYKFFGVRSLLSFGTMAREAVKLWNCLKSLSGDVYILRSMDIETMLVSLFSILRKKKYIYMIAHDDMVLPGKPTWIANGLLGSLRWQFLKKIITKANIIVVQHNNQKENLKKYSGRDSIVRPAAHFIDSPLLVAQSAVPAVKKSFVLWVGRCEPWKRPELFIDLARNMPTEKFVMVCPQTNDGAYYNKIQALALSVSNLRFIKQVQFKESDNLFAAAKIFVNTSLSEGFPNTFIQAAKSQTPILSLKVNPDGMLERFDIGMCAGNNVDALVALLNKWLNDGVKLAHIGQNGLQYAKDHHDISRIIKGDKKMILSVIDGTQIFPQNLYE